MNDATRIELSRAEWHQLQTAAHHAARNPRRSDINRRVYQSLAQQIEDLILDAEGRGKNMTFHDWEDLMALLSPVDELKPKMLTLWAIGGRSKTLAIQMEQELTAR